MRRRRSDALGLALVACALAALPGCGGDGEGGDGEGGDGRAAKRAAPQAVIRAWADTLRRGDVKGAASYFKLPALVENGTPPLRLRTRAQVREFNEGLPCGARLLRTYRLGRYTAAVFELTERPGPGRCGSGTGQRARTAFLIRTGRIIEWRRLPGAPARPAPSAPFV